LKRAIVLALIAAALIALAALVVVPAIFTKPEQPATLDEFVGAVKGSDRVALVMDVRGAPQPAARIIYQCGADLALSLGMSGKNVTAYVIDDAGCTATGGRKPTSECLAAAAEMPYFTIAYGMQDTTY